MADEIFGTDGVRGTANSEPITPQTVLRLAMATGQWFRRGVHRHLAVIGKDTRLSGYMLEPALTSGLIATGMDVVLVGPLPTPAVAMLTRSLRADLGVVISASHNPHQDNGIKLFGPDGYKLSESNEREIEQLMSAEALELVSPDGLGRATRLEDAPGRYIEFVKQTFPRGLRLDGLKIVVDCANGAAYRVAPTVFWELGAEVVPIAVQPEGTNINRDCGTADLAYLSEQVVAHGADLGIALDGDADRLVLVDEAGTVIDGDQILALIASAWHRTDRLHGNGVVSTVMSNLGLERYLHSLGLKLVRTLVGDRYIVEHMRQHKFNVGGEQSGHIVLGDYSTTGDGLIAALQVLALMVEGSGSASDIGHVFEPLPQLLRNVPSTDEKVLDTALVQDAIRNGETQLGETGRLVIRVSGTEPVIRIMAEGEDKVLIDSIVSDIVGALEQAAAR
jgi:phosphoglucosamine mutase